MRIKLDIYLLQEYKLKFEIPSKETRSFVIELLKNFLSMIDAE